MLGFGASGPRRVSVTRVACPSRCPHGAHVRLDSATTRALVVLRSFARPSRRSRRVAGRCGPVAHPADAAHAEARTLAFALTSRSRSVSRPDLESQGEACKQTEAERDRALTKCGRTSGGQRDAHVCRVQQPMSRRGRAMAPLGKCRRARIQCCGVDSKELRPRPACFNLKRMEELAAGACLGVLGAYIQKCAAQEKEYRLYLADIKTLDTSFGCPTRLLSRPGRGPRGCDIGSPPSFAGSALGRLG